MSETKKDGGGWLVRARQLPVGQHRSRRGRGPLMGGLQRVLTVWMDVGTQEVTQALQG